MVAGKSEHLLYLIEVKPAYPASSYIQDVHGNVHPYVREGSMCNPYPPKKFNDYSHKRGNGPKKKKS